MTPESLIGAFDLLDRWRLMLLQMQGQMPELPALPGRVHAAPPADDTDDYPARHQRELQAAAVWRALALDGEGDAAD